MRCEKVNDLGDFLRKLRGKMTYREASELSGVSHAYIRYLEIGKRPGTNTPINPSPEMLRGLAKAYNHSYKDLMMRAGYSYEEGKEEMSEESEVDAKRKQGLEYIKKIKDSKTLDLAIELLEKLAKE